MNTNALGSSINVERLKQRLLKKYSADYLQVHPLSHRGMATIEGDPDLMDWHLIVNDKNIDRYYEEQKQAKINEGVAVRQRAHRQWQDHFTPDETAAAMAECTRFVDRYPQFIGADERNSALLLDLKAKSLPVTFKNLVTAFEDLASRGLLILNPSTVGVGPETEITGTALRDHPQLDVLLAEPRPRKTPDAAAESADEFLKRHPDLVDDRIPLLVLEGFRKNIETFLACNPAYDRSEENKDKMLELIQNGRFNTSVQGLQACYDELVTMNKITPNNVVIRSGSTKMVNYEPRSHQPLADIADTDAVRKKNTLQQQIAGMTSQEYIDRLRSDLAFNAAVEE